MKRRPRLALVLVAVFVVIFSACGRGRSGAELILAGSTSIQPFADKWAEVYMGRKNGCVVNVQGGGSSAGIQACRSGACQIGMSSRDLKPDEKDLTEIVVARDGLAVIVHPGNPVSGLTLNQVRDIFSGVIRRWSVLGGPDREITVVTREEGSGTRGAFQELVMKKTRIYRGAIVQDSNGTVREIVAHDPWSVGYISLGLVDTRVRALPLEGVAPTDAHIGDGTYKLVRPFLFLINGPLEGTCRDFIDFVLSPEGQALVREEGLLPIR
jgi:phosphate transport system substrate-binding protein